MEVNVAGIRVWRGGGEDGAEVMEVAVAKVDMVKEVAGGKVDAGVNAEVFKSQRW